MKFMIMALFCVFVINQAEASVVPKAKTIVLASGKFEMPERPSYSMESVSPDARLNEFIEREMGFSHQGSPVLRLKILNSFPEEYAIPKGLDSEAYLIRITSKGIDISAKTPRGLFYGCESLQQLLEENRHEIQCQTIADYPDMAIRGISDDISRGQVSTLENFKKIIDHCAKYKLNVYMPYIEDVLEFSSYPSIGRLRGALSKSDVKELVTYAQNRFVDVIPAFQTLGHYENVLSKKEFAEYAEFPGSASLSVSNEKTYEFLGSLLKEVCAEFPSEFINIGADESYDVALGQSKPMLQKSSIENILLNHYLRVYGLCKEQGKKVMMYGDIILNHPDILKSLPKDICIIDWHYRPDFSYPSTRVFKNSSHEFIVCPSVWNFQTGFPNNGFALPNIKYFISCGIKDSAQGAITSSWGDYGAETPRELCLYGYAYSASCAWNLNGTSQKEFDADYFSQFFGIRDENAPRLYEMLSNPMALIDWHSFWRHPLLAPRSIMPLEQKQYQAARVFWLDQNMSEAKDLINRLQPKARKNIDHFDILRLIVDMNLFYRNKLELSNLLLTPVKNNAVLSAKIDSCMSELQMLKERYRGIWLKYYREENLCYIMDKFSRLAEYLTEIKEGLSETGLESPLIKSSWIYMPGNGGFASKAEFKKEIDLDSVPLKAPIQLLGDTHAVLKINGIPLGEVSARRSLSLSNEYNRIFFCDAAKFLKAGKNLIEVQVESFNREPKAGFNLYSEIETKNGKVSVLSDGTWLGSSGEGYWRNAVSADYGFQVIAPCFKRGRTSWIER